MQPPELGWVITLDGPAGSGKSTTARRVARALDFVYLDTGALYRAVTFLALRAGVPTNHGQKLRDMMMAAPPDVRRVNGDQRVICRGEDLTDHLRSIEVEQAVSSVSAAPEVRKAMLEVQRAQRQKPGLVAEGRDLGSIVFPDADLKIYLVADLLVRAERRALERNRRGESTTVAREQAALAERDRQDTGRAVAPLVRPQGAHLLDTTGLSIAGQTQAVVDLFREVAS